MLKANNCESLRQNGYVCTHCVCGFLQVRRYLDAFARHYQLHQYVQFSTQVLKATPVYKSSQPSAEHARQPQSNPSMGGQNGHCTTPSNDVSRLTGNGAVDHDQPVSIATAPSWELTVLQQSTSGQVKAVQVRLLVVTTANKNVHANMQTCIHAGDVW